MTTKLTNEQALQELHKLVADTEIVGYLDAAGLEALRMAEAALRARGEVVEHEIDIAIFGEIEKAVRKFPTWPTDPLHALSVLGEEFGELTKDVLQMVYEPHKTSRDAIRTEAIQTAAMALRFARSLGRYEYKRGEQHSQSATHPQGEKHGG